MATNYRFPTDCAAIIDVTKPPYNIDNTGKTDCTETLCKIIDDVLAPITGSLKSDGGKTEISWQNEDEDLQGTLLYDAQNDVVERKITSNGQTIVYDESKDTLLEEDASLIKFYFDLCELPIPSHIIKVNDTTFLLSDENNLNDEEDEI